MLKTPAPNVWLGFSDIKITLKRLVKWISTTTSWPSSHIYLALYIFIILNVCHEMGSMMARAGFWDGR